MTSCYTPVVIHDETLDRTTSMTGRVAERPWFEVGRAVLRRADGSMTDQTVPNLLRALPDRASPQRSMLVEIKPDPRDAIVEAVAGYAGPGIELQSFELRIVLRAIQLTRGKVHLLVEDPEVLRQSIEGPWAGVNVRHDLLDGAAVERLHAAGKRVGVWTVNDERDLRRALAIGVDTIITDEPLLARKLMESL